MNRVLAAAVFAFATSSAPALAEGAANVTVPAGTQIKMYVVGDVTAQSTHPGTSFAAQAASDVVVDGLVVVRKGAEGQGTVGNVPSAHSNTLTLVFDWVYAADGTKIRLSTNDQPQPAARKVASTVAVAPASLTTFGMAGFFGIVSVFAKDTVTVKTSTQAAE